MVHVLEIARAKHVELDAQYNGAKVVEGATVAVPNIVDRVALAVRGWLANRAAQTSEARPATPQLRMPARQS